MRTTAISVENTHNFAGGTVLPLEDLRGPAGATPTRSGCAVHIDGARIWNAHVATGYPLAVVRRDRGHDGRLLLQGARRPDRVG